MRFLLAVLLLGAQEPDVRKKLRIVDNLEARLAALAPFAADFQFSRTKDGKTSPGSSVSLYVDFPGKIIETKVTVVDDAGGSRVLNSVLDQGRVLTWSGNEAYRGDIRATFEKIQAACDRCGRELENLLPSTPENPAFALPRGLSLSLHVDPKKSPDDAEGGYRVAVSFPGPTGSWLEIVRRADDAVVTERGDLIHVRIPSRETEIAIERATGLPLEFTARDVDGMSRRIARTRYVSGAPRLALPRPDPKTVKPMSFGVAQGYVAAYAAVVDAAARRLRLGWSRLVDREAKAVEQLSVWAARDIELFQRVFLEAAADRFIQDRLDAGAGLGELEAGVENETRAFLAALGDAGAGKLGEARLKALLKRVTAEVTDDAYLGAVRRAFDVERVAPHVVAADLKSLIGDALRRARGL